MMKHILRAALLCLLMMSASVAADAAKDLLLHATFEDTADAVVSRGDGKGAVKERKGKETVSLPKAEFAEGAIGKGIVCGDSYVEYSGKGNLNPKEGTIEMWVKPMDWQSDDDTFHVFLATSRHGANQIILYKYMRTKDDAGISRSMAFYVAGDPGAEARRAVTMANRRDWTWKPGQWRHIAATWNPSEVRLFVDGAELTKSEGGAVPATGFETIQIAPPWGEGGKKRAVIDDVRIYGRALTPKEVRTSRARVLTQIARTQPQSIPNPGPVVDFMRFPAQKRLLVYVSAAALGASDPSALRGQVVLTHQKLQRAMISGSLPGFGDAYDAMIWLPTMALQPGSYDLSVEVTDAQGKSLGKKAVEYVQADTPAWMTEKIADTQDVLPPYPNVKVDPHSGPFVKVWGREYNFGETFFLREIIQIPDPNAAIADCVERFHREARLLAGPIELKGTVGGKELHFGRIESKLEGNNPAYALVRAQATTPDLFVKAGAAVAYDGIIQHFVVIHPQRPLDLSDVRIEIPIQREYARLMNHNGVDGHKENCFAGAVPQNDGVVFTSGWKPLVWVGDEYRGLAYIGDTSKGWYGDLAAEDRIQIVNDGNVSTLVLRLIPEMKGRTEPIQIEFALVATPLRPLPEGWRGLVRDGVLTAPEPKPGDQDPIGEAVSFRVWWSSHPGMTMHYSYPVPKQPADVLKKCWTAVPYVSDIQHHYPNDTWEEGPESKLNIGDWSSLSTQQIIDRMGGLPLTGGRVDWDTNIREFWLYNISEMMKLGLDGMYVDDPYIYPSYNDRLGKAWRDEEGNLRPCYGMFGLRDWFRRVRALGQERSGRPWIDLHMSGQLMLPFYSFCDSICNGEHLNLRLNRFKNDADKHYLDILPVEELKAQYMSYQWGVAAFLLPELGPGNKESLKAPTREVLAQFLPHDVLFWRGWCKKDEVDKALRALQHDFRIGEGDCRFLPYWEAGEIIRGQGDKLVCSAYLRPGRAMLVVGNWSDKPADARFALDLDALGLDGNKKLKARDAVARQPVEVQGATVRLTVAPRDYTLVWVENE